MLNEKMWFLLACYVVLMYFINSFTVVSTSLVAQGNEVNTVLAYALSAVAGFVVVMLALLLVAIAIIRCRDRKQQQRMNINHSMSYIILFAQIHFDFKHYVCMYTYMYLLRSQKLF